MKAPLDHAKALLKKAANDLIAAEAILDTVCFHAQQAVEKSLKAILAFHDVSYPWRHDLEPIRKPNFRVHFVCMEVPDGKTIQSNRCVISPA